MSLISKCRCESKSIEHRHQIRFSLINSLLQIPRTLDRFKNHPHNVIECDSKLNKTKSIHQKVTTKFFFSKLQQNTPLRIPEDTSMPSLSSSC